MNFKITLNQKRFLIIWICIHSFALFVNLADIKGEYSNTTYTIPSGEQVYIKNLFTNSINKEHFWPFTDFTKIINRKDTVSITPAQDNTYNIISLRVISTQYFNGIFTSYNFPEFIFYILLGFGIVFIPIMWSKQGIQ